MSTPVASDCLNNRVILITGAAGGIGAAVAKAYASHGASIILLDKNIPKLEQVYDEIEACGGATPAIYPLDLKGASTSDYDALAESIHDNFERLDGLVHCAATLGQLAPTQHQDPKVWLETLHINLTAPYLLTRSCLPLMQKYGHASIIFTTDNYKDKAYWGSYGISKAATEAFSKQLADEMECDGRIRVNCIDPGKVKTNFYTKAFPAIDPESIATPEKITDSYIYLMSDDSQSVNGQIINAQ